MTTHTVSRRDFVVVLTASGGGLMLGWRVGDRAGAATAVATAPPGFAPNAFIRIRTDGRVTLVMPQVEMGTLLTQTTNDPPVGDLSAGSRRHALTRGADGTSSSGRRALRVSFFTVSGGVRTA